MPYRYRTRTLSYNGPSGSVSYYGGATYSCGTGGQANAYEAMSDDYETDGPPFTSIFTLGKDYRKISALRINGSWKDGAGYSSFNNYGMSEFNGYGDTFGQPAGLVPSLNDLAIQAFSNLNPNKPVADLPLFIFELKDLPRLLKDGLGVLSGNVKPSQAAGGYVAYSFGVAPLVSDVISLLDFAAQAGKRRKYIEQLTKGHRLRRSLGGGSAVQVGSNFSMYPGLEFKKVGKTKWNAWYTAKVSSTYQLPPVSPNDSLFDDPAFKAAYGLQGASASAVWNAVPWSWLIDYFASIGSYLEANRGGIPFQVQDMAVMCEVITNTEIRTIKNPNGFSITGGRGIFHRKLRDRFYRVPLPGVTKEFLSLHQAGILASLATAGAFRSAGK